jgi:hypothetical protein
MLDGENVLLDRPAHLPELAKFFGGLDDRSRQVLIRCLGEVNRRAGVATLLTQAYTMERMSRLRWAQYKGLDLSSTGVTGFEGTESMGLNWAQLTWRAFNHFEDLREQCDREYENAKFIASASAGKGMNKIYSQDKLRRKREREERVENRDKIIRCAILGEPLEGPSKLDRIQVARSVSELQDEVGRALSGQKDFHDRVIEQWERQAEIRRDAQEAQREQFRQQSRETFGDQQRVVAVKNARAMTPEEMQEATRRHQDMINRLAPPEDSSLLEKSDKWLGR